MVSEIFQPVSWEEYKAFQKQKHLTFFDGVYIASMKQFYKESVDSKV